MKLGMITLNQNMEKKRNYVIWIQTTLWPTKKQYIYSDILKDVETISDTSNYKLDKPLPKGKKSYLINERWTRRENYSRVCCIKTKNIQLLNRW